MSNIPETDEELKIYVENLFNKHVEKGNKAICELIDSFMVYGYKEASHDDKKIVLRMHDAPDITISINERYFNKNNFLFDLESNEKPYILNDPTLRKDGGVEEKYYN